MTEADREWLDTLPITHVISGGALGADRAGEEWAKARGISLEIVRAEWRKYGNAAGPMRNSAMAEVADAVVLFTGGAGTASMRRIANFKGLTIYERES